MPKEKSVNFGKESEKSKSLDNRPRGQCRVGLATRARRVRLRGRQPKQSGIWVSENLFYQNARDLLRTLLNKLMTAKTRVRKLELSAM
jgi:hypothetical protein